MKDARRRGCVTRGSLSAGNSYNKSKCKKVQLVMRRRGRRSASDAQQPILCIDKKSNKLRKLSLHYSGSKDSRVSLKTYSRMGELV